MKSELVAAVEELQQIASTSTPEDLLGFVNERWKGRVVLASSFGEEDQVLTDMVARVAPGVRIFTLDTGRLFPETYELIDRTIKRYPMLRFDVYFPDAAKVEEMVREKGINLFYDSVANRKHCCHIRKVEPMERALADADVWITGLRHEQAGTRSALAPVEWDEANGKVKISPLAEWSLSDVRDYVRKHKIAVNSLHAQGFVSVGCAPCTRAIRSGEDIRAGRWWWERSEHKECGIHNRPQKKKGS